MASLRARLQHPSEFAPRAESAICIELNRVDTKPSGSQLSERERH